MCCGSDGTSLLEFFGSKVGLFGPVDVCRFLYFELAASGHSSELVTATMTQGLRSIPNNFIFLFRLSHGSFSLHVPCDMGKHPVQHVPMALRCDPGQPKLSATTQPSYSTCRIHRMTLLVAMPFAPSSFLLLVVGPGAPSSVLAPSSDALCS